MELHIANHYTDILMYFSEGQVILETPVRCLSRISGVNNESPTELLAARQTY